MSLWKPLMKSLYAACALLLLCAAAGSQETEKPKGPARFDTDIQKFEAADRANTPQPGGVLFYGSSSARLWDLSTSFPKLAMVNRGFGGSDMQAAAHFYERVVPAHKPRILVLYEGDNDLNSGRTACQILADFEALITKHKAALPDCQLICLSVKYSPSRAKQRLDQEAANALLKARCAKDPQLRFLDVATVLLDSSGQPDPKYFKDDKLHLNPEGYALWNAVLSPLLEPGLRTGEPQP